MMMKPPTVFLGEMTNPEVEAFLKTHHTVIIPTGATEQHGPHGPLLTTLIWGSRAARRADNRASADQLRAVVSASFPAWCIRSDVHGARRRPVRVVRLSIAQAHHFLN
jgi:hypothetical protein